MTDGGLGLGDLLLPALGLMLLVEGLMPLLNPRGWRAIFEQVTRLSDGQIRFIGLAACALGALILALLH